MNEPEIERSSRSGLVYRFRESHGIQAHATIMLHGLGGDENSMWVLEHALPTGGSIVAPRGLFNIGERSYSWVNQSLAGWPSAEDFLPAVKALKILIAELKGEKRMIQDGFIFMGFSQGAALAFAAAADPALSPKAVIAAAGFLPKGQFANLVELPVFWGHGTKDNWIPIERARRDVQLLKQVGARIQFCETDVGHKLGMECLNGLKGWINHFE